MGSVRGHSRQSGSSGGVTVPRRSGRPHTVLQREGLNTGTLGALSCLHGPWGSVPCPVPVGLGLGENTQLVLGQQLTGALLLKRFMVCTAVGGVCSMGR